MSLHDYLMLLVTNPVVTIGFTLLVVLVGGGLLIAAVWTVIATVTAPFIWVIELIDKQRQKSKVLR